ncbi:MAG: hypothetical protein K9M02_17920 [Thiohalocapsa sp.]|nr:hypothetical protein [Thiohalocapsa sp.]
MRKSAPTRGDGGPQQRPWLAKQRRQAAKPPSAPGAPAGAGTKDSAGGSRTDKQGKRFVEPYPYTDAQRSAIIKALARDGLGDATAREIFVGAIAYDLALLEAAQQARAAASASQAASPTVGDAPRAADRGARASMPRAGTPAPRDEAPAAQSTTAKTAAATVSASELAQAAGRFAEVLDALDRAARDHLRKALDESDPFDRAHDENYLSALVREARRVALAAAAPVTPPQAQPSKPDPQAAPEQPSKTSPSADKTAGHSAEDEQPGRGPSGEAAAAAAQEAAVLAFVRHAASVYEQCFDARPSTKVSDPFARVLTEIAARTGIALPVRARILKQALERKP